MQLDCVSACNSGASAISVRRRHAVHWACLSSRRGAPNTAVRRPAHACTAKPTVRESSATTISYGRRCRAAESSNRIGWNDGLRSNLASLRRRRMVRWLGRASFPCPLSGGSGCPSGKKVVCRALPLQFRSIIAPLRGDGRPSPIERYSHPSPEGGHGIQ